VTNARWADANAVEVEKLSWLTGVLSLCGGDVEQASTAKLSPPVLGGDCSAGRRIKTMSHPQSIGWPNNQGTSQ
jgi:hypothetical protein